MFVWMAKFGAAYGVRTGIHVGVDVLINRLTTSRARKFILFGLLAGALFTGIVGTLGADFVWENGAHYAIFRRWAWTRATCPKGRPRPTWSGRPGSSICAVPLGSYLMCFRFLQVRVGFVRTGELPHHDHGHVEGVEEAALTAPARKTASIRMDDDLHPQRRRQPPGLMPRSRARTTGASA